MLPCLSGVRSMQMSCQTRFAKEYVVHLACHVEGRQQRAKAPEIKRHARDAPSLCGVQDGVFAPEAGEEQRKSAQRQHAYRVSGESNRHKSLQSAHAPDILLFMTTMNDRAGAKKEQRFEEGMRDEMKHADCNPADTQTHHHVTQLRNGGIGEDALNVILSDGDQRSKDGCDSA